MDELELYLLQQFELLRIDLAKSITSKGLRASGKSIRTLEVEVKEENGVYEATLSGEGYLFALQDGRRPTKRSEGGKLIKAIKQWLVDKGLEGQLNPYAVTKKIHEEGIKVPNQYNPGGVISDVINKDVISDINKKALELTGALIKKSVSKVL